MFDAQALIEYGGLLIVFLAIYGQTGLFFCFFIPSGAFMFAAGAMIAAGHLDYGLVAAGSWLLMAAVMGNLTGYYFGRKAGRMLHERPDSRFFKKEHIAAAERFYERYGRRALAFGLFLPIVRTFAPIVAGMIRLNISRFLLSVTLGSVLWIFSFLMAGYAIGSRPMLKPFLNYIVAGIVIVVSIPVVIKIFKALKREEAR
ncbi:MAG TPA: DedA family protein [Edaphocola sp.]|nr:DedA family protein [Edaphocola sp.]